MDHCSFRFRVKGLGLTEPLGSESPWCGGVGSRCGRPTGCRSPPACASARSRSALRKRESDFTQSVLHVRARNLLSLPPSLSRVRVQGAGLRFDDRDQIHIKKASQVLQISAKIGCRGRSSTRWSTHLSSKVNLPHAVGFLSLCGANLVT